MKSYKSVKDASLPFPNDDIPVAIDQIDQSNNNPRRLSIYTVPEPVDNSSQQNNNGSAFTALLKYILTLKLMIEFCIQIYKNLLAWLFSV